jgi:hypothetical protein
MERLPPSVKSTTFRLLTAANHLFQKALALGTGEETPGEDEVGEEVVAGVEERDGDAYDFGQAFHGLVVGDVLALLVLLDAGAGRGFVDSGLDSESLLPQPAPSRALKSRPGRAEFLRI